jgi:hypothetical protein
MTPESLKVRNCRWIAVPGSADARGSVNFLEAGKALDFEPKRLFWLHHIAAGQWRGRHGHRKTRLVLIAMHGSCRVLLDDGTTQQSVTLDDPTRALQIDTWVWHELTDFAPATAIAVLASTPYEEAEYLRDYDTFKREVGAQPR